MESNKHGSVAVAIATEAVQAPLFVPSMIITSSSKSILLSCDSGTFSGGSVTSSGSFKSEVSSLSFRVGSPSSSLSSTRDGARVGVSIIGSTTDDTDQTVSNSTSDSSESTNESRSLIAKSLLLVGVSNGRVASVEASKLKSSVSFIFLKRTVSEYVIVQEVIGVKRRDDVSSAPSSLVMEDTSTVTLRNESGYISSKCSEE
mmetsp:Transcript_11918/g.28634  ORF Transcript_11918/g.28634 Transcript_11918/m.28634 type:complete len:202 (+) Transcript_11918:69-674(+)